MTRGLDWRRHKPASYSRRFNVYDLYAAKWSHIKWEVFYRIFLMMVASGVLIPCTNTRTGTYLDGTSGGNYVIDEDNVITQRLTGGKHDK